MMERNFKEGSFIPAPGLLRNDFKEIFKSKGSYQELFIKQELADESTLCVIDGFRSLRENVSVSGSQNFEPQTVVIKQEPLDEGPPKRLKKKAEDFIDVEESFKNDYVMGNKKKKMKTGEKGKKKEEYYLQPVVVIEPNLSLVKKEPESDDDGVKVIKEPKSYDYVKVKKEPESDDVKVIKEPESYEYVEVKKEPQSDDVKVKKELVDSEDESDVTEPNSPVNPRVNSSEEVTVLLHHVKDALVSEARKRTNGTSSSLFNQSHSRISTAMLNTTIKSEITSPPSKRLKLISHDFAVKTEPLDEDSGDSTVPNSPVNPRVNSAEEVTDLLGRVSAVLLDETKKSVNETASSNTSLDQNHITTSTAVLNHSQTLARPQPKQPSVVIKTEKESPALSSSTVLPKTPPNLNLTSKPISVPKASPRLQQSSVVIKTEKESPELDTCLASTCPTVVSKTPQNQNLTSKPISVLKASPRLQQSSVVIKTEKESPELDTRLPSTYPTVVSKTPQHQNPIFKPRSVLMAPLRPQRSSVKIEVYEVSPALNECSPSSFPTVPSKTPQHSDPVPQATPTLLPFLHLNCELDKKEFLRVQHILYWWRVDSVGKKLNKDEICHEYFKSQTSVFNSNKQRANLVNLTEDENILLEAFAVDTARTSDSIKQ